MKGFTGLAAIFVVLAIAFGLVYAVNSGLISVPNTPPVDDDGNPVTPVTPVECDSTTAPNVTVKTADHYGGAAIVTYNAYRKCGESSWTNGANGLGISANVGDRYEILIGVNSSSDGGDIQPYGPHISCDAPYVVPCQNTPQVEYQAVDDALATDLTVKAIDPNDQNVIAAATDMDIDAAQIYNVKVTWQGLFEADFGNRYTCSDVSDSYLCMNNVFIAHYNTTQYDDMYLVDMAGNRIPSAQVPTVLSSVTGYTDKAFKFPVLKSNAEYTYTLVIDTDDSYNPTGNQSNITLYLYDGSFFLDNDLTPSLVSYGLEDEDDSEVGASAADSFSLVVYGDN